MTEELRQEWDEMTLRRNLLRIGYELQKAHWTFFETGDESTKDEYSYRILHTDGHYYVNGTDFPIEGMTFEQAVIIAKDRCKQQGSVYEYRIPERELESGEECYIEQQTEMDHDDFYSQMLEQRGEEIERLEINGKEISEQDMKRIESRWELWVDDMTENTEQNLIAECLNSDPYDDDEDGEVND